MYSRALWSTCCCYGGGIVGEASMATDTETGYVQLRNSVIVIGTSDSSLTLKKSKIVIN
jgi:hypothetical protein